MHVLLLLPTARARLHFSPRPPHYLKKRACLRFGRALGFTASRRPDSCTSKDTITFYYFRTQAGSCRTGGPAAWMCCVTLHSLVVSLRRDVSCMDFMDTGNVAICATSARRRVSALIDEIRHTAAAGYDDCLVQFDLPGLDRSKI
jgi:hypothetical protein